MKKKKKIFIIVGIVVVVLVVVLANVLRSGEKAVSVEIEKVKKGDITSVVTATGKMKAKTVVKISADVSAKIVRLPVKEGDRVKQGQLLVQLDPTQYQEMVNETQAQLKYSKTRLEEAKIAYERQKKLFEKNLATQEAYDVARIQHDGMKTQVEQAEASLKKTKDYLSKTTILAPMDGIITDLNAEVGEIVIMGTMNNPGTVIMTLSDMSEIEVEVEVDETDVGNVKLGQSTKIKIDAFPDTVFQGKVTEIGNSAQVTGLGSQSQTTNFITKVLLEDKVDGVRPGMSATVDITTGERKGVLSVPIQAVVVREESGKILKMEEKDKDKKDVGVEEKKSVIQEEEKKKKEVEGVFVMEQGKAKFVKVATGIANQQYIEIVTGLNENQDVVTGSYRTLRTLKNDDKIKVVKSSQTKTKEKQQIT